MITFLDDDSAGCACRNGLGHACGGRQTAGARAPAGETLNARVQLQGSVDGDGVLAADRIRLRRAGVVRIEGPMEAVADPEFTIVGIEITTTNLTEFDDIDRAVLFSGAFQGSLEVEGSYSGGILVALAASHIETHRAVARGTWRAFGLSVRSCWV